MIARMEHSKGIRSFDVQELKRLANGRWAELHSPFFNAADVVRNGSPCPKCGGKDRFYLFKDFAETGATGCRNCGKHPDGISTIRWLTGWGFKQACEYLHNKLSLAPPTALPATKPKAKPFSSQKLKTAPVWLDDRFSEHVAKARTFRDIEGLKWWADQRRVNVFALIQMGCAIGHQGSIVSPERNVLGEVIGLQERFRIPLADGQRFKFRGYRGFQFVGDPFGTIHEPAGWLGSRGFTLIVEGWADVASCLSAMVGVVGRPSRDSNLTELATMFCRAPREHRFIVVCENDGDTDEANAEPFAKVAARGRELAAALLRPVDIVCPPRPAKDINDFWKGLRA